MTPHERAWWKWHYDTAIKNGLPEAAARKLADQSVASIRKHMVKN